MSMISLALALTLPLAAPADEPPGRVEAEREIEIVVETKKRPDWLFPGLDHPRVQAFFGSSSTVGDSLMGPSAPEIRPLVRAGSIRVENAASRADRRAARRFARDLVDSVRPALEACYVDALDRTPTEATRLTFRVELSSDGRGPVLVQQGMLGDVFGNACVHGVLEFAEATPPRMEAAVEIPVWFWLQTVTQPSA